MTGTVSITSRAESRIQDWFFSSVPIDSLVLARIVFGFALFFCYVVRLPDAQVLYGPHGLAGDAWVDPAYLAGRPLRPLLEYFLAALPSVTESSIGILYGVELLTSLCFAIGFRTRTSGAIALLIHALFSALRLPTGYWGWATHIQPLIVYVLFSQAGRYISVDSWLARRAGKSDQADDWNGVAWPLRLVQIHTCTMYLVSGGERLDDPGWIHGEALWIVMNNLTFTRLGYDWTLLKPVLSLGTWFAWVLEPVAVVLLWVKNVGPWIAYLLIGLHVGLELLSNVGWWNFVMIAALLSFVPPSHTRAIVSRLPGGRSAPAVAPSFSRI